MSISSVHSMDHPPPPAAIVPIKPSNAFMLVCSLNLLKKRRRQDATLANSYSYLFMIGNDRSGALLVERVNNISQFFRMVSVCAPSLSARADLFQLFRAFLINNVMVHICLIWLFLYFLFRILTLL